jgi:hypothetical protein
VIGHTGGLAAVLVLVAACERARPAVVATWTGADTGRLAAPAVAHWCPDRRLLEITAVQGDSGVALVAYPNANWGSGTFPLFDPLTDTVRRPSAAVAIRWPMLDQIVGYRSVDGLARLTRTQGRISGTVQARLLRSGSSVDTLSVELQLPLLTLDSSVAGCPPDSGSVSRGPRTPGIP